MWQMNDMLFCFGCMLRFVEMDWERTVVSRCRLHRYFLRLLQRTDTYRHSFFPSNLGINYHLWQRWGLQEKLGRVDPWMLFYVRHISLVNTPRTIMLQVGTVLVWKKGETEWWHCARKWIIYKVVNLLKKP